MDKYYLFKRNYNPGSWCSSVNVVTVLLVEWQGNSGFGFGLGAMFFFLFSVSYGFGDPQTSCAMDTGRSCHGIKMAGDVKLPNDLNLVPRPKTTGAVFILSYIFMTCCLRKHREIVFFSFKCWIELGAGLEDNDHRLFNYYVSPFEFVSPNWQCDCDPVSIFWNVSIGGKSGGAVGSGRLRVRFPMIALEFTIFYMMFFWPCIIV